MSLYFGWHWINGNFEVHVEPYTAAEVRYSLATAEVLFDVAIDDVRKERGKEDLYTVTMVNMLDRRVRVQKELLGPDFERIVGIGKNTVRGNMYTLTYYLQTRDRGESTYYVLEVNRFTAFEQLPFSVDNVDNYVDILVDYANGVLLENSFEFDRDLVAEATGSSRVTMSTLKLNKADIDLFPLLPAQAPDYIDSPLIEGLGEDQIQDGVDE